MKYLLLTVLFVSCNDATITNSNKQFTRYGALHSEAIDAFDFKFREHDYIQFGYSSSSTVVHNPDCLKCKNK